MMEKQYLYKTVKDDMKNGVMSGKIGYSSKMTPLLSIAVGIWLLLLRSTIGYIAGAAVIVMSLCFLFMVKDHATVEVYEDHLLLFEDGSTTKAVSLPFSEIKEFDFNDAMESKLWFEMTNGQRFTVTTFCKFEAARLLNKTLDGKSHNSHVMAKLKSFTNKKNRSNV